LVFPFKLDPSIYRARIKAVTQRLIWSFANLLINIVIFVT